MENSRGRESGGPSSIENEFVSRSPTVDHRCNSCYNMLFLQNGWPPKYRRSFKSGNQIIRQRYTSHIFAGEGKNSEPERRRTVYSRYTREDSNERRCNGRLYNKTFSMTTLVTTEGGASSLAGASSPPSSKLRGCRATKVVATDENPGKILRGEFNVLDRFIARVAVVDSVEVRSAFEPLIRYKFEKIKTFRVHSREFLQSSLPIL